MIQYANPPHGQNPSPQGGDRRRCPPLPPGPQTPEIPPLEPCDESCCCPRDPGTGTPTTCLDDLIAEQAQQIEQAQHATDVQADLQNLLNQATDAKKAYTREKYNDLLSRWDKQGSEIAGLIEKLVCTVKCWKCVIECEICPLLYTIRQTDIWLNGTGQLTTQVFSLRDLRYWQDRNREAKQKVVDRIKAVLDAWAKPAETIEKNLTDNAALIEEIKKILGTDSANAIYLLFVKLIPMHLAIAPRNADTKIEKEYTSLCCCYPGDPDDCCGPDLGEPSLLQELIGPQPYIVDPDKLFDIICCIAKERYLPAKDQFAAAASDLAKTEAAIDKATKEIVDRRASIAADYKANVANPIDCCDYKSKGDDCGQQDPCQPAQNPKSQPPQGR